MTDATTGAPVEQAIVSLLPQGVRPVNAARRQFTDSLGRFVFLELPADAGYSLVVNKTGFYEGAYGRRLARTADLVPITLTDSQWFSRADVTLWRPGTIRGAVSGERGQPLVGVFVRALTRRSIAGRSYLIGGPYATTDDRGQYRIGDLLPGTYVVMVPSTQLSTSVRGVTRSTSLPAGGNGNFPPAVIADRLSQVYPITFSGDSQSMAGSTPVDVRGGTEQVVEIRLKAVKAVPLRGRVIGPAAAMSRVLVRLLMPELEELGLGSEVAVTTVGTDGGFSFPAVPPGSYVLDVPLSMNEYTTPGATFEFSFGVRPPRPPGAPPGGVTASSGDALLPGFNRNSIDGATHWARMTLVAGDDGVDNITVPLHKGSTVSGRLQIETDPRAAPPRTIPVLSLESATGAVSEGRISAVAPSDNDRSSFLFEGVPPGSYLLRPSGSDWLLKSVLVNGRESIDTALDCSTGSFSEIVVTLTNQGAELAGVARNRDGNATAARVVLFPVEPEQWSNVGWFPRRVRLARATTTGRFQISKIPAGAYFVIATEEDEPWYDQQFLARASTRSTRITLAWGDRQTADLTVTPFPRQRN